VSELARGRGLVAEVTPDGSRVLVRAEQEARRDAWRVFAVATGRAVATLTYEPGAHAPAVVRARAYYLLGPALCARDLESDTVAWRLPLGDRRGAAPPPLRQ
jgi:hypothetical protein